MVWLQISLLIFSLVAPIGAIAAEPTDPPPSEEPSAPPTPEPSAEPTAAPDPSATPEATTEPTPDPTPDPTPASTPAPTGPFIVTFAAGVSAPDQAAAVADAGATSTDTIAPLRMHAVSASSAAASVLAADVRVVRVEPDRSRATEADPSDPSYGAQWALPKIGWDQVSGTAVSGSATVAILDTGVDGSQPDLAGQLVGGASFVGGSATDDPNGHGTAMAGIVAASTDNGVGIAGVGWDGVSIMPVSVLGADGTGRDSDVIEGLVWAADHDADVALMAFSASGYSSALQTAVDYAWSRGMVLVAATGNDGSSSASFPAGDRSVIGVSNTDASDALNASSNYGAATFIAAPGTGIVTLAVGDGTTTVTGTSASAAHVAAAAAVLRASDGSLSNGVIVGRLARTADAAGTAAETGNGRLNLARAMADTSTDSVQPAGAAPNGNGGPFVGPYVADNINGTSALLNGFNTVNVGPGAVMTLAATASINNGGGAGAPTAWNSTGWVIATSAPAANTKLANCVDTANHAPGGPFTETFSVTVPTTPGTYTLYVEFDADDGTGATACGDGTNHQRDNATAVIVFSVSATLNGGATASVVAGSTVTAAVTMTVTAPTNNWQSTGWAVATTEPAFRTKLANCVDTANVASGATATRSFTFTAPTTPGTYSVYFAPDENDGTGANACGDGSNSVRLTLSNALVVTPANSSPVVTPAANQSTNEGSSTSFALGSFADAGPSPWAVDIDWGDGSAHTTFSQAAAGTIPAQSHTYPNGPATHTVIVSVTDTNGTGLTGTATFQITVNNVAPTTAYVSGDLIVNESTTDTHTYVFSIFDPGNDTITGIGWSCGVGGTNVPGSDSWTNTSLTFACKFLDGPATPSIQANAADPTAGPFTFKPIQVNNVAPTTAYVSGDLIVNESDTDTHTYVFSIFDPGADTITGIGWSCGVGGTNVPGSDSFTNTSLTFACKFLDGPATPSIQANAADPTAGPFTFKPIQVNNVAPVANNDSASTGESTVLITPAPGVLGNDTDVVNDPLVVGRVNGSAANVGTEIVLPSGAKLTLNADGSYTYDPNGVFEYLDTGEFGADSFTYAAFDGNDFSNTALVSITIVGANDPPVAANALASVGHLNGAGVDVTLSATDADGDPITLSIVSSPLHGTLGALGPVTCTGATPNSCSAVVHYTPNSPSGDFVGDDTFTYRGHDGDVFGNTATVTVTLTNAAPTATVSLAPSSPTTNQVLTATATKADADGDPVTLTYVWKNGTTTVQTTTTTNLTSTLNLAIVGNGDKGDTITVFVTPSDGHVSGATVSDNVTVINSNPVITDLTATPSLVDEGNGAEIDVDATDADGDVLSYEFNCTSELDAVYEVGPTSSDTYTCIYDDGPDGHLAAVRVTDTSGGFATASVGITVQNVAPTGTFSAVTPTVNEGSPATVQWTNVTDPSNADTAAGFRYTYACSGSISDLDGDYTHLDGSLPTFSCTYFDDDPGFHSVASSVIDKNNGNQTTGVGITVLNVPPTLSNVAISSPVFEGGVATLTGTIFDPGTLDTFTLTVDWGDGTSDTYSYPAGTSSFSQTHTYVDDNPSGTAADTYTVSLSLSDDDGGSDTETTTVQVLNISPEVSTEVADFFVNEGSAAALTGTISDPGVADTFTLTVNWGEGAPVVYALAAGSTSFSVSHVYADDNPTGTFHDLYDISWLLVDDDGGGAAGIEQVSVENVPPNPLLIGEQFPEEGTTETYSFTWTDPGIFDTFSLVDANCGVLGTLSDLSFDSATKSGSFKCYFADDDPSGSPANPTTIHVEVVDDDTLSGIYDIFGQVLNVDPVADIEPDVQTVNEGDLAELDVTVTDQGPLDTFPGNVWLADCDYGQHEEQGVSPFDHFEFTPNDDGTCEVEFHVSDDDGGEGIDTAVVTVNNVAPTAAIIGAPTTSPEGTTISLDSTVTDPSSADTAAGFTYAWSVTKNGSPYNSGSSSSLAFTPDDNGTYVVTLDATDKDGGTGTTTATIAVTNVAPTTAYLSGDATVLESGVTVHTYVFSIFDPGTADTMIGDGSACGTNGLPGPAPVVRTDTSITFSCIFPDGPANYVIQANATDDDGATGPFSFFTVQADNVAPTAAITGAPATSPEGTAISLGSSVSDPSPTDTTAGFTYVWSVTKNGVSYGTGGLLSTFSFTPDDNGTYVVSLQVTDKDGGVGTDSKTIGVTNVAPTAIITGAPSTSPEGTPIPLGSSVSDPSSVDVTAGFAYAWSITKNGSPYASGTASTFSFTPDDNGTYVVSLTATDKDAGTGTAPTKTINVFNVGPTVVIDSAPSATSEGATAIHFTYHWTDPGADTWTPYTKCGPTGLKSNDVSNAGSKSGSFDCRWADDNPTTTSSDIESVTVKVTDDDLGSDTKASDVGVSNVAPTITSFTATTPFAGPLVFVPSTFKTIFNDPGTDTFNAEFTWGDGSPVQTVNSYASGQTVDHTYLTSVCGLTASVKVIDDDTGNVVATANVNVGSGTFMAPMTNQPVTNKLKNGQVLPVKVQLTDCLGVGVTGLTPAIRLVAGDQTATFDDTAVAITPPTVSGADTDGWMRPTSPNGNYMYNMKVNIPLNTDYTVVIYPYANQTTGALNAGYTLRHVIQATK